MISDNKDRTLCNWLEYQLQDINKKKVWLSIWNWSKYRRIIISKL